MKRKVMVMFVALAILVLATTATPYAVEGFGGQDLGEGGNPYHAVAISGTCPGQVTVARAISGTCPGQVTIVLER